MRTITATFTIAGATAQAVARFHTLPGESAVEWSGATDQLARALGWDLPSFAYAGGFQDAMRHMGERAGAAVTVTKRGSWEVQTE